MMQAQPQAGETGAEDAAPKGPEGMGPGAMDPSRMGPGMGMGRGMHGKPGHADCPYHDKMKKRQGWMERRQQRQEQMDRIEQRLDAIEQLLREREGAR
jgi:hypothetical protein